MTRRGALLLAVMAAGCAKRELHQEALALCDTLTHRSGPKCRKEVEQRFPDCGRAFLANETTRDVFTACLGFYKPIVRCVAPNIAAELTVSLAKGSASENSTMRFIDGQTMFVAAPALHRGDVQSLRLEDHDGTRVIVVGFSPAATAHLQSLTLTHRGELLVVELNKTWVSIPIPNREVSTLLLPAGRATAAELCR